MKTRTTLPDPVAYTGVDMQRHSLISNSNLFIKRGKESVDISFPLKLSIKKCSKVMINQDTVHAVKRQSERRKRLYSGIN